MRRYVLALFASALTVAAGSPAGAYVRSRSDAFVPTFWPEPRQPLEVARPPDGIGISSDDLRAASMAAINSWSYPKISCTAISLRLEPGLTDSQVAARDGVNRIIMRVGSWCRDPVAMTHCHDANAVALTTIFSRSNPGLPDDGQILEADIEVNAVGDFTWAVFPEPYSSRDYANLYDLTSALTHETGHFIGLDHTCLAGPLPPGANQPVDDQGDLVPDCNSLPPGSQMQIQDATMFPLMNPADVKLRTLTDDDERAACEIYPALLNEWGGGGGCAVSPTPISGRRFGAVVFGVALALGRLLGSRRRRSS